MQGDRSVLTPSRIRALAAEIDALRGILAVERAPSSAAADALFRKRFGQAAPDYPTHYIATYVPLARVVGYVHMSEVGDLRLCGGLCVDEMAYRAAKGERFSAIRAAGGIGMLLLKAACLDGMHAKATFAYTGNRRSRELIEQIGFTCVCEPYLFALWHSPSLSRQERGAVLQAAKAVGPF